MIGKFFTTKAQSIQSYNSPYAKMLIMRCSPRSGQSIVEEYAPSLPSPGVKRRGRGEKKPTVLQYQNRYAVKKSLCVT